ncbi:MAG: type II secretion system F family protein [Victivallales bacterium]|nr:type II secretion system F family protein [Victivallales bacterium]
MPLYKFKAADSNGKVSVLVIEGDSGSDVLTRLRHRKLTPIASYGVVSGDAGSKLSVFKRDRFNVYEFTDRLVPLLKAHIPLERALGIIANGMEGTPSAPVVNSLRCGLHEGKRFSELIRDNGPRFPRLYANLVQTGEETGNLAAVMGELHKFLTASKELKEFIITSSIYPLIIMTVTAGVILLVFTFFIPHFAKIFADMGRELPLLTKILLNISNAFIWLWWLWPLLIGGVIVFWSKRKQNGPVRDWWDRMVLKLPLFGQLIRDTEMSRFIRTLAILIGNHVHLLKTIRIATRVIGNGVIAASFDRVTADLKGGRKLSVALSRTPYVPKLALQMLMIGEESGNQGEMLDHVAEEMENALRIRIKRLLAFFEPAMILTMAMIIFVVVLAIFLPIMEMNNI